MNPYIKQLEQTNESAFVPFVQLERATFEKKLVNEIYNITILCEKKIVQHPFRKTMKMR